jgi:hypothetical protein
MVSIYNNKITQGPCFCVHYSEGTIRCKKDF